MAQFGLGCLLNDGHGIKKNNAEALKWIERAARQEFEPAKKALGKASPEDIHGAAICYRYGIQVDIDHDQFLVFLKLAAKRGNALAQESLAELDVA